MKCGRAVVSETTCTMAEGEEESPSTELIIDAVLCYVSTARHSMRSDDIMRVCLAFFKDEDIIRAKDMIYEIAGVKPKRRRHENRMINEMQDLLDMIKLCDENKMKLPKYVSDSFDSMPPTSGFEVIATYMKSFIDEIVVLKDEIKFLKENRFSVNVDKDDAIHMKEDIIAIKGELRKLNHRLLGGELRRNSMLLQSLDKNSVIMSSKKCDSKGTKNANKNSERNADCVDLSNFSDHISEFENIAEISGCALEFQRGSVTPIAPTYADLARVAPRKRLGEVTAPSSISFSPSAPTFSQISSPVRGSGVLCGEGGHSLSPSAPPLSQESPSAQLSGALHSRQVNVDSEGFTLVENKKKKSKSVVVGSRRNAEGGGIKGAKRVADLYIGNCDLDVSVDSLISHISKETGIRVHKCEPIKSKSHVSKSFKISLNMNDRQKLLNPDIWPEDIVCRKFYNPRHLSS